MSRSLQKLSEVRQLPARWHRRSPLVGLPCSPPFVALAVSLKLRRRILRLGCPLGTWPRECGSTVDTKYIALDAKLLVIFSLGHRNTFDGRLSYIPRQWREINGPKRFPGHLRDMMPTYVAYGYHLLHPSKAHLTRGNPPGLSRPLALLLKAFRSRHRSSQRDYEDSSHTLGRPHEESPFIWRAAGPLHLPIEKQCNNRTSNPKVHKWRSDTEDLISGRGPSPACKKGIVQQRRKTKL